MYYKYYFISGFHYIISSKGDRIIKTNIMIVHYFGFRNPEGIYNCTNVMEERVKLWPYIWSFNIFNSIIIIVDGEYINLAYVKISMCGATA